MLALTLFGIGAALFVGGFAVLAGAPSLANLAYGLGGAGVALMGVSAILARKELPEQWEAEQSRFRAAQLRFLGCLDESSEHQGVTTLAHGLAWPRVNVNQRSAFWLEEFRKALNTPTQRSLLDRMEKAYAAQGGVLGRGSSVPRFLEFHTARQEMTMIASKWGNRLRRYRWGQFKKWAKQELSQYRDGLTVLVYAEIVLAARLPSKPAPRDSNLWALGPRLFG